MGPECFLEELHTDIKWRSSRLMNMVSQSYVTLWHMGCSGNCFLWFSESLRRIQSERRRGKRGRQQQRGGGGQIVMELLAELLAVHGYSCSWWLQLNGANRERGRWRGGRVLSYSRTRSLLMLFPVNTMQTHTDMLNAAFESIKLNETVNVFPNVTEVYEFSK